MKKNPKTFHGVVDCGGMLKGPPSQICFYSTDILSSIVYLYTQTPDGAALSPLEVALI